MLLTDSSPLILVVEQPSLNDRPFCFNRLINISEPSASSCRGSKDLKNSIIVILAPVFNKLLATSIPSRPPPIMTMFFLFLQYALILSASEIFLKVKTPFFSTPLIGGIKGLAPCANKSLLYSYVLFDKVEIVCFSTSMFMAVSFKTFFILFFV